MANGENASKNPHDVITAPTRRLKYGNMAHGLTREESRRGAEATNRLKAERALEAERAARERLREEVLKSVETYIRLRDDPETPPATRLAAADRVVDHVFGKPTQRVETEDVTESRPLRDLSDADLRRLAGGAFDRLRASKGS